MSVGCLHWRGATVPDYLLSSVIIYKVAKLHGSIFNHPSGPRRLLPSPCCLPSPPPPQVCRLGVCQLLRPAPARLRLPRGARRIALGRRRLPAGRRICICCCTRVTRGAPLAVLACGWIGSLDWCNLNGLTSVYTLFPLNSHALRAPCTSPSCRPPRAAPPPPTRPPRCWTQSPGSTGASWHSAGRAVEKQTLSSFLQDAPLTKSGSL